MTTVESNKDKIITLGNTNKSNYGATRVISVDGISCTVMENHGKGVQILEKSQDKISNLVHRPKNYEKIVPQKIRLFDSFAGVGALHSALKKLNVDVELVGVSEVDPDAIINYSAIHNDDNENFESELSIDEKREYLMSRNIGYVFEKDKSSIPRMRKDKLEKLYRASVLSKNFGDISKLNYDELPDFDLFNFSFPCTDISNSGKQLGLTNADGTPTRSGLVKYGIDVIRAKKPAYILIENVKALIQKKFIGDFNSIIKEIEDMGYCCYYPTKEDKKNGTVPKTLNAKDFGIPQNRERIYVICIRKDVDTGYSFPVGFPLNIRLKDILEDEVEEKYYLSKELQERFTQFPNNKLNNEDLEVLGTTAANPYKENGNLIYDKCTSAWVYNPEKLMSTLAARDYKQPKQIVDKIIIDDTQGFEEEARIYDKYSPSLRATRSGLKTVGVNRLGGCFDKDGKTHQAGSVYGKDGLSPTITTCEGGWRQPLIPENGAIRGRYDENGKIQQTLELREDGCTNTLTTVDKDNVIVKPFNIRKLTPRECWRLMAFTDEEFDKAKSTGTSDSALYKQAGNSIVVDVLYFIFKNLFNKGENISE